MVPSQRSVATPEVVQVTVIVAVKSSGVPRCGIYSPNRSGVVAREQVMLPFERADPAVGIDKIRKAKATLPKYFIDIK